MSGDMPLPLLPFGDRLLPPFGDRELSFGCDFGCGGSCSCRGGDSTASDSDSE